jgi:transcriptional regulator with XRE-family HTH domain
MVLEASEEEGMGQPAGAPPPDGSFGALLRAFRHRAYLSQEQLAARAELSERTVRNIEAGRVRSPHTDTVRLLADALALTKPEQQTWVAAAQGANGRQAEAGLPGSGYPARLPRRVTVAVLTADTQDGSSPAITWLIGGAGQTLLVVHCAIRE